jgi:hypothetical protein
VGRFIKNSKLDFIFGLLFPTFKVMCVLILAKKWVGLHFGRYFSKLIRSPCSRKTRTLRSQKSKVLSGAECCLKRRSNDLWQHEDVGDVSDAGFSTKVLYLGSKCRTRGCTFVPGYVVLYLGMLFCTWVCSFVSGYVVLYLGM